MDDPDVIATLRPRRAILPAFLVIGLFWALPLVGSGVGDCDVAHVCLDAVTAHLAWVVGVGLPTTYLSAVGVTAVVDRVAAPADRFPAVFDPARPVLYALSVVVGVAGIAFFLAGYGALFTAAGAWLLLILFGPFLTIALSFSLLLGEVAPEPVPEPAPEIVVMTLVVYVSAIVVQVGWWYVLAHGVVRVVPDPWRVFLHREVLDPVQRRRPTGFAGERRRIGGARRRIQQAFAESRPRIGFARRRMPTPRLLVRSYRTMAGLPLRRLAVGTVVLIAGISIATTAVTVADPALSRPSPPDVDASDGPATIAEDALAQTRHRDYVVTVNRSTASNGADFKSDPTANFRLDFRMDVTDREYRMHRHSGFEPLPRVMYGNSVRSWGRFDSAEDTLDWGSYGVRWGNDRGLFPRFDPIDLEEAAVTLVRANDSTIVLNVTDPATAYRLDFATSEERPSDLSGYASITVDRETGAPRQVTVVTAGTNHDGEVRYRTRTVMTFVDWDDVDVSRPRTVPYTLDEVSRDAARIDESSWVVG